MLFKQLLDQFEDVECGFIIHFSISILLRVFKPSISPRDLYSGSMYNLSFDAGTGYYSFLDTGFTHSDFHR